MSVYAQSSYSSFVVKRILHYFNHTQHLGLYFSSKPSFNLSVFSNVDWVGCLNDCKSIGGYCIYFDINLISWESKKQPIITRPSMEVEYKSIANTICDIFFVIEYAQWTEIFSISSHTLWYDNIGVTYLSINPILHSQIKQVELDYHFAWEKVAAKYLKIP